MVPNMRKNRSKLKTEIDFTDMFCGCGGSSIGAEQAGAKAALAFNHWQLAGETYSTNFQNARVMIADVSAADPRNYPSTLFYIGSPECTNHSLAKGVERQKQQLSMFKDERPLDDAAAIRSRATMWDPIRFAELHRYEFMIIENVVDARKWVLWDAWYTAFHNLGYELEVVYLNSMFAHVDPRGKLFAEAAPQSRDRMYVVAWKKGNKRPNLDIRPLAPCPHCAKEVGAIQSWKNPNRKYGKWGRYGKMGQYIYRCPDCTEEVFPYYFAAANAIDWSLKGTRIGDRTRPLKEKTIARIKKGIEMFAGQRLIVDLAFGGTNNKRARPVSHPFPSQTKRQTFAHVHYEEDDPAHVPPFAMQFRNNQGAWGLNEASPTFTAGAVNHSLVHGEDSFVMSYYSNGHAVKSATEPMPTVTTKARHALVNMPFMLGYANGQSPPREVTKEMHTVATGFTTRLATPGETPDVEDCYFRMFDVHEIKAGMAIPQEHELLGTKREKIAMCGNAVTPPAQKLLVELCLETLQ